MATIEEIGDKSHDVDGKATNGDTSLTLEYSGLSEDTLNVSEDNSSSIAEKIAQDFAEDLEEEHVAPAPSAKAIRREINESHALSDDEFPKTLTTLETVKKQTQPNDSEGNEMRPMDAETEDDDFEEEEPVTLLEVYNEDDEHNENENGTDLEKIASVEMTHRERKHQSISDERSKGQTPKLNNKISSDTAVVTPNKPIPTPSAGTIEIPRELLASDASVISPIIINHINIPSGDDLIAILEGDDNGTVKHDASVEHYAISLPTKNTNGGPNLTAEEAREIAMEQIMSLPKKKKGRPKLNQALKAARESKVNKKTKNAALVNSLMSEWNENDAKHDDTTETEIVVEIRPQKKQAIVEPAEPTFRRSRIIKKKIIWDPDAPETAINYASLAHTSGAGPAKRARKMSTRKTEQINDEDSFVAEETTPLAPAAKKKKSSEIDKLLGDEGAANMLNSLHRGNNNNNKVDGMSPGKIPRAKAVKVEAQSVQTTPVLPVKAKAAKSKELPDPSPQKQLQNANKKNGTPKAAAAGKKRGPKTSESWDYIYKSRPDDCMIIRRRSNSSYSSTASLNRTSIDLPNAPPLNDFDAIDADQVFETQAKRSRSNKEKNFEFAKPRAKKIGKVDNFAKSFDETKNSTKIDDINFDELPVKLENGNEKDLSFTQISVSRFEHFTQIILHPEESDSKSLFTVQMFKEIEVILHSLENDKTVKLVLLTTANENFCNGVDYSTLVQSTGEKRRVSAMELSKKLFNFVQMLAAFKKPLVVFVKGIVNGLGARILPLFDVVWAENCTSFCANSHDYGEIIEGTALLSAIDKIDYNAKAKLLFLNEVMDAEEAKDCNIVTQVLKEGQGEQRVLIECEKLATKSSSTLETYRLIQQQNMLVKLKESLKIEQKQLLQQWLKSDFIEKIKAQL